jgi:hypothetical protein
MSTMSATFSASDYVFNKRYLQSPLLPDMRHLPAVVRAAQLTIVDVENMTPMDQLDAVIHRLREERNFQDRFSDGELREIIACCNVVKSVYQFHHFVFEGYGIVMCDTAEQYLWHTFTHFLGEDLSDARLDEEISKVASQFARLGYLIDEQL